MAGGKKHGSFAYGDVYALDETKPDRRGNYLGKLIVNQDTETFYIRPPDRPAKQVQNERVSWFIANGLIDFDHDYAEEHLVSYLMSIERGADAAKDRRRRDYQEAKAVQEVKKNTRLNRTTRRRAIEARLMWVVGCIAIVALGYLMSIPAATAPPAEASIAGVGQDYGVESDLLQKATYLKAIGNGPKLYGLLFNDDIVENGQRASGENVRQENVLVNAEVSTKYPIHLRPLYYDKVRYYQTTPQINDSNEGASAVLLQNPNGYSLGKAANDLVYVGGAGMASITLSSPGQFQAITGAEAQESIIEQLENLLDAEREGVPYLEDLEEEPELNDAITMPEEWNGYDSCDIDENIVVASYWYTKDGSKQQKDLMRRIVVMDISSVIQSGSAGIDDMEMLQFNFQDKETQFYEPVVSKSPSSHDMVYWIGYTKQSSDGSENFYLRRYEQAADVIRETYENTFSTVDLTNSSYPMKNYTLYGDYLFYEQQGYIWVMDLSKLKVSVSGDQRTIEKENPMRICRISEMRAAVDRDEAFKASLDNTTANEKSQYQVISITTSEGVEYGLAFIEADTGNLVFQPCRSAVSSNVYVREGDKGDTTGSGVTDSDRAYLDEAQRMLDAVNQQEEAEDTGDYSNLPSQQPPEQQNLGERNLFGEGQPVNGIQTASSNDDTLFGNITLENKINGTTPAPSLGDEVDNGRILIKAGSSEYKIVCFCVRGEQFYWIEENTKTSERRLMLSPVYYKNDALQLLSDELTAEDPNAMKDATSNAVDNATVSGTSNEGDSQITQRTVGDSLYISNNTSGNSSSNMSSSSNRANAASNDGSVSTTTGNVTNSSQSPPQQSGQTTQQQGDGGGQQQEQANG